MKSLALILAIGITAFLCLDLKSESFIFSVAAPIALFASVIALAVWLAAKGGLSGNANSTDI